jgi:hypothetical protein
MPVDAVFPTRNWKMSSPQISAVSPHPSTPQYKTARLADMVVDWKPKIRTVPIGRDMRNQPWHLASNESIRTSAHVGDIFLYVESKLHKRLIVTIQESWRGRFFPAM